MIPYEILIRGNADGTLSGCHVVDVAGGAARAITAADLEALAPSINVGLLEERPLLVATMKSAAAECVERIAAAEGVAAAAITERDAAVKAAAADCAEQIAAAQATVAAAITERDAAVKAAAADCAEQIAAAQATVAAATAERDAVRGFAAGIIAQAKAALADDKVSNEERLALLSALVAEAEKPAKQREREAIERQIADLQSKLEA